MNRHARRALAAGTVAALACGPALAVPTPAQAAEGPFDASTCTDYEPFEPAPAWQVDRLDLDSPALTASGEGITIAVLDTGIDDSDNPVLEGVVAESLDFAGPAEDINCQHGTQVASLIAGQTPEDGSTSFRGVAPRAKVIGMRVLTSASADPNESGQQGEPLTPTIAAIDRAIEMDVDIINISQQGTDTVAYQDAITRAIDAGIVVVAAAGNQGDEGPAPYPASYPGVIAVGMTDSNDVAHESSQSHPDLEVTVAAPGVDVLAANPSGGGQSWEKATGTSFATPIVSGTVALMLEDDPSLTPPDVRKRLQESADPPAGAVPDPQLGYGVVNPGRAMSDLPALAPAAEQSPEPPQLAPHPHDRPEPNHLARNLSVGFALGVAGIVTLGLGTVMALRARRDR